MWKKDEDTLIDEHSEEVADDTTELSLEEQIAQLTKKLAEQEEIVKRAQSDYFRTKMEFDEYVRRADAAKSGYEVDGLVKALEKVLPFVHQLETTIQATPEELKSNARVEWVQLIYTKMITDLWVLWVTPIKVDIGSDPDYTLHIPIGMEDVEDQKLKNKITKVIEWGFVYEKGEVKKVIMPAKVMVGS